MVRKNGQNRYIIFVSIPRSKPAESSGSPDGLEYYYDHIAIFATENKEKAHTIAELLTKDYEGGPGEDYPEGFIFKSEAEMSLQERVRANDQLSNLEDWALQMHEEAARYAEKAHMLVLSDVERNESSSRPDNWEQVSIDILDDDTVRYKIGKEEWKRANYAELDFKDNRKGLPNKLWGIFREMAKHNDGGFINMPTPLSVSKDIDRIRRILRQFFGVQELPIKYDRKVHAYHVNFNFTYKKNY
ncbi:MAG: hypothetical protein HQ580_05525 [Planctomycetes bacterium]|nr:hypothetical protein [Planctomycetota bacterium]